MTVWDSKTVYLIKKNYLLESSKNIQHLQDNLVFDFLEKQTKMVSFAGRKTKPVELLSCLNFVTMVSINTTYIVVKCTCIFCS